jgi:hypothetical protein
MAQGQIFTKMQYAPEASAYGTEGTSYTELPRVQSGVINSDNGLIYDRGLGEGLNATNTYYGPFVASGTTSFDVVDFDFLKHWIGNKSGAGTSGDKYTLTEATSIEADTAGTGILQPFSVEVLNDDTSDTVQVATGCVGTDFTLSGSIGSKLMCESNFIAQKTHYRSTHETYTPNTNPAFIMINGTWKWGATPSALSGVQSFSISYSNGLNPEATRDMTSRFIGIPKFGQRSYNFNVGIIMSSSLATTIINDFYGSESSGLYSPEDGSSSISPTANLEIAIEFVNGSKYATVQLDQCSIDRISIPREVGDGIVVLNFEGTAREGKDNAPILWWSV